MPSPPQSWPRLTILIPAHDEEEQVAGAVESVLACSYPPERCQVVVVADNCTDHTADRARQAGAEVLERDDPDHRGKAAALAWAVEQLDGGAPPDAVVLVDADCACTPNLLEVLGAHIAAGSAAVQSGYWIADPDSSQAAALRWAGFALINHVRPLGRANLGLSCGLLGTGMAFPLETLRALPFSSRSITEDREYHLRMVEHGLVVRYAPQAEVTSPAPESAAGAETQEMRWDAGNSRLTRTWLPRLLTKRGPGRAQRLNAAIELALPPQSGVALLTGSALAGALVSRSRWLLGSGLTAAAAQAAYVVGGLIVSRASPTVWGALAGAPGLIARRAGQFAGIFRGRAPADFRRTERGSGEI